MEERTDSAERPANLEVNSPAQGEAPGNSRMAADAQTISDSRANVAKEDLTQGVSGSERNPEFGNAADPSSEKLGTDSRDSV